MRERERDGPILWIRTLWGLEIQMSSPRSFSQSAAESYVTSRSVWWLPPHWFYTIMLPSQLENEREKKKRAKNRPNRAETPSKTSASYLLKTSLQWKEDLHCDTQYACISMESHPGQINIFQESLLSPHFFVAGNVKLKALEASLEAGAAWKGRSKRLVWLGIQGNHTCAGAPRHKEHRWTETATLWEK